jgi:hypothetical protein
LKDYISYVEDLDNDYCESGYYCPLQSETPTLCNAGYYCPIPLMSGLNDAFNYIPGFTDPFTCTPGFDCTGGSHTPTPLNCQLVDESTTEPDDGWPSCGDICQPGYYCEGNVAA